MWKYKLQSMAVESTIRKIRKIEVFKKWKLQSMDCNQDYYHSQYRLQPDYDGNMDTMNYSNNYDWYICSVVMWPSKKSNPIVSWLGLHFQFRPTWYRMLAKIGNWLTCLGFYSNFNSSTTCIGFGAKFCRNRIIDGTLQKFDTNEIKGKKLKIERHVS